MNRTPVKYVWKTRYSSPSGYPFHILVKEMRLHDVILDCIFYLYPSIHHARKGKDGGTGFFVNVPAAVPGRNYVYMVTNKHVAVDEGCSTVALNNRRGSKEYIHLDPDGWIYTDNDDLAIYPGYPQSETIRYKTLPISAFINADIIAQHDIGIGDHAYIVGRFQVHEGKDRILPVARFGNISQMPQEPLLVSGIKQEVFLVEMRSIGGFSGSPAFVEIPPMQPPRPISTALKGGMKSRAFGPWLLGVDVGHLSLKIDIKENKKSTGYYFEGNSAMTGIIPAWRLMDLLNDPRLRDIREEANRKMQDENPPPDSELTADLLFDLPSTLSETIRGKIESGEDESIDEHVFKGALDRAISPEKPDQGS